MTVLSDLAWPVDLEPYVQGFYIQPHVGRSTSPFTRQQKIYGLSAPRWMTRLTVRGDYRSSETGARMDALITRLRGGERSVSMWDFRRPGLPEWEEESFFDDGTGFDDQTAFFDELIDNAAAAEGASEMSFPGAVSTGLAPGVGDYIGGDGRPHIVVDRYISGGSYIAEVDPPFSSAIEAGMGTFVRVAGKFRLVSDDAGTNQSEVGQPSAYDVELVEDI